MLKMVDGTGIIGVDMVCPLGGAVSPPQPPNYDNIEMEGVGSLMLPNSLKAPLERLELIGNSTQGENPSPDNPQEIKSAGRFDETSGEYLLDVKVNGKNLFDLKKIKKGFVTSTGNGFDIMESSVHPKSIYLDMVIPLKVGQTLNISGVEQGACRIRVKHDTGNYYLKYTANKDTEIIICFYSGLTDEIKKTILIEISDTPTNYEPYTEQSMQIVLNEPLRGIGEYKDVLTKDGVVRRILEAPLVKYLKPVINGNVGNRYVFAEVPNANINYDRERCMSNVGFTNSTEKKKYIPHPYHLNFLIRVADDDTIEMVKEKIKDIIVAYTAKEPITEPLPESVQAQLAALHTENGTTHVFVDSGEVEAGIKLTYRKEK